ncbi:glycosyltransferase [Lishizhenia sp.]|uniref:glycosyltransferase n=1 Tax=Lishizhenia sp. TaxID=2497594 RepID=UPI00299DA68E|nr:glycosyltransferase [Lishizhenia sp.]MDX1445541.1 glycosyltransferase [Lishizhenia sp.]
MKILFLADVNSSHTRKWVMGLRKNNIEVAIFSMSAPREDWYTNISVECVYFGADPSLQDKQSAFAKLSYLKAVKEVKSFVKKIQPDVVHAHYATSYGLLGALCGRRPYIISVWGSDIQDFPYRSMVHKQVMRFIFNKADLICSTSDSMLKDIDYVGAKRKVKLPFGINLEEFKVKTHIDKDVLHFGTVKTMDTVYGVDILIRAFHKYLEQTKRKDVLELYGKGPQMENLKDLVKVLGIDNSVHFHGYVNRVDIAEAYLNLDVYMSLSRRESYGVAALEASVSGLPLITSEAEGFKEVLVEGETGYRVEIEPLNLQLVVDKMMLLQNVELRKEIGLKGRERVVEFFNFENDIQQQIKIYRDLLDEGVCKE